jgi:multicomponent Na+:H+ antiporter subunit D
MPFTSIATTFSSLAISGVPPFNGFWSKLIIVIALFQAKLYVVAAITVLVSFITLLSFIKLQRYTVFGDLPEALANVKEKFSSMAISVLILAALCLALGLAYPFIIDFLKEAAVGLRELLHKPVIS